MYTDTSSPPSSPTAYNDSSPPSSPGPDLNDSDVQPEEGSSTTQQPSHASPPLHLLAASAKSYEWKPPDYEKGGKKKNRRNQSPSSPTRTRMKKRRIEPGSSMETVVASPISFKEPDRETRIWDQASNEMVDNANGNICLEQVASLFCLVFKLTPSTSDRGLSRIPKEFATELSRLCVLDVPLTLGTSMRFHVARLSASLVARPPLLRSWISKIPHELLCVEKLTVLSLRSNKLEILPPSIQYLKNLRDLNVSGNRLKYLPAEILQLKRLENVMIFPNPFLSPDADSVLANGRMVSQPSAESCVPRLIELGYRILFSGGPGAPNAHNLARRQLAVHYELPLDPGIPSPLARVFSAVHPGSMPSDPFSSSTWSADNDEPSLGTCPSPHHSSLAPSTFVSPMEERYTWEKAIGTVVAGGTFPMKWRGCLRGCLDFLVEELAPPSSEAMDVDVVQAIQLDEGGFGEADFEEE
ncbi:hypothetical protein FB45DRAFT_1088228 [Roridomyces roridus]|uniref:Leucine rich repeat domain-containing protein n=1 Tax=Roridomyces roridus TaxID=1738132 RepID=A0AAD7BJX6_9AGAR|nr:hypothetical protein FB45DRAFT_1088228 [Roridomyces roridus]